MECTMTDAVNSTGVDQADYLKLFMQELTYQDPLKPVDNREFMAQMAQFSALQETRTTNEYLSQLIGMNSANQSLNLLGKKVLIKNASGEGTVTKVEFFDQEPPKISVQLANGEVPKVELSEITQVSE